LQLFKLISSNFTTVVFDCYTTVAATTTLPCAGCWSGDVLVDGSAASASVSTLTTPLAPPTATSSRRSRYPCSINITGCHETFGSRCTAPDDAPMDLDLADDGLRTSTSGAVFVGPPAAACRADARRTAMPPPPAAAAPLLGPPAGRGAAARRLVDSSLTVLQAAAASRVPRGLARSCGDALLKRAATVGLANHRAPAARSSARSRGGAPARARSDGGDPGRVPSYLALDDHRYTLRCPPPNQPPSKTARTGASRQSANSLVGVTSILEAFLRSTRPVDPNQGSNAALAAAGLAHLPLPGRDRATAASAAAAAADDDDASGTLLKKLLTGEFDQGDVRRATSCVSQASSAAVDSLLSDGLALDGCGEFSFNLLDDVPDDALWMNTHADDFSDKVDVIRY